MMPCRCYAAGCHALRLRHLLLMSFRHARSFLPLLMLDAALIARRHYDAALLFYAAAALMPFLFTPRLFFLRCFSLHILRLCHIFIEARIAATAIAAIDISPRQLRARLRIRMSPMPSHTSAHVATPRHVRYVCQHAIFWLMLELLPRRFHTPDFRYSPLRFAFFRAMLPMIFFADSSSRAISPPSPPYAMPRHAAHAGGC